MKTQTELPECGTALRELFRRQVRLIAHLLLRILACALLLTLLKPLWGRQPWLGNILFGLGGLVCGVPLLKEVAKNWQWRIRLGLAYFDAGRLDDAEVVLAPLTGVQGQLFDPSGKGQQALHALKKKKAVGWEQ